MSAKNLLTLLFLLCLNWGSAACAQETPAVASPATGLLLTKADTVAALQDLFQAKRKSSGWFLAATPVALGATVAGVGVSLLAQLGPSPNAAVPLVVLGGGVVGTVAVLNRYTRYTKGSEREVLSKFEKTRKLPGWARRNLVKHRAAKR